MSTEAGKCRKKKRKDKDEEKTFGGWKLGALAVKLWAVKLWAKVRE